MLFEKAKAIFPSYTWASIDRILFADFVRFRLFFVVEYGDTKCEQKLSAGIVFTATKKNNIARRDARFHHTATSFHA